MRAELARHDDLYFRQAKPEITDAEYDRLKRQLEVLEAALPDVVGSGGSIGDDRSGSFPTYRHRERMLSLAKTYSEEECRAFLGKLAQQLGRSDLIFVVEPKYDGLAISLTYAHGELVHAVTRGNGWEGDEVTANVRLIPGLSGHLAGDPAGWPTLVELRGEVFLGAAEFARINAEREAAGGEPFAHPRNLAGGTLKTLNPAEVASRHLSVVLYGWGAWEGGASPSTQQSFHAMIREWGLPGVADFTVARSADEVWAAVRKFGLTRGQLGWPIDGAVVKLDDTALRELVGSSGQAPRWAAACKFEPERVVTRLRAITVQVGRTGRLTPVAEFDPVVLGGATVERASLHNRAEITRRDIRVGDFIEVEKAGEIVPAVTRVLLDRRPESARPYAFPSACPSCGAELTAKPEEAIVFCPNDNCPAQRQRRLEHFVSDQAVDIPGIGPALIAALVAAGRLGNPADFYRLQTGDLRGVGVVGEPAASRLLAAIERSKQAELERFIHGFGIPLIGPVTARQLATVAGDLNGFVRLQAGQIAGVVGPAATGSVVNFLGQGENQVWLRALLAAGVNPKAETMAVKAKWKGQVFVFTGTLPGLTRAQAADRVRARGGMVRDRVSGRTDYVVAGEGAGGKLADARRWGVRIVTPEEFAAMLADVP